MAKVPLTECKDMVKTIASDRTDEPLRVSILPRRLRHDRSIRDARGAETTDEDLAIDAIPIANDISRCLLPAVWFGALVSMNEDLGFQCSPRPEQSDQAAPDQPAKIAH